MLRLLYNLVILTCARCLLLRLLYNLVILPWRNFTMMFAPLHLFALGREEECALLGALMLVVNVSTMEDTE